MVVAPVLVIPEPARTAKASAVPSGTGVAIAWAAPAEATSTAAEVTVTPSRIDSMRCRTCRRARKIGLIDVMVDSILRNS